MMFNSGTNLEYKKTYFQCPRFYAKDGFHISIQISHTHYVESDNGYRQLGKEIVRAEFGFTSIHEPMLSEYSDEPSNTTESVGSVPIEILDAVMEKHGGIDWEKTSLIE